MPNTTMKRQLYVGVFIIIGMICLYFIGKYMFSDSYPVPPTFVINLDDRTDRYEHIRGEFSDWISPVERVSAVRMTPGWQGCTASHLKCIQLAKERNYPWVLIVEDDCKLMEGSKQAFVDLLPFLWLNRDRWDMFNGGTTFVENSQIIDRDRNLSQTKGLQTHFYLIHKKAYDIVIKGLSGEPQKIDIYYKYNLRMWVQIPFIARQLPGMSDIENDDRDYNKYYDRAESALKLLLDSP